MVRFNPLVEIKELGRLPTPKGKFSLFYALELARNYQLVDTEITRKKYRYLMQSDKKQREMIMDLIGNLGIDGNAKSYGLGHLGVVQAFWDKEFPDMYRIVAFDLVVGLKLIFKGEAVKKYEVCVVLDKGHWDGMKSVTQFFKVRNFCVSCEMTYDRPERHRLDCKERCKKCCRMGFGFPCKQEVDGEHLPNLVSAAVTCSVCSGEEKECEICGEDMLMADLKIYEIKAGKVCFRDFWMLSQNPLSELPKTLELEMPAKLYFPHKYNRNENFGKRLPHLPPFEDYLPGGKKEKDYEKFEKWYNENYETEFELGEQLRIYCENDVEILMAAVLKFRKLFLDITKDMDVIKDSVTIAGIVMKVFRAKFLKERHIPIVPEGGYEKADKQSKIAVRYFEWLAHREGVKVRHALNGGELKFGGYKVDCVVGAQKRIIEFQGCAWHGCGKCYLPWTECDVKKELKRNREMKKFFEGVPDKGPINPRDAFSGGRTMPFCLFAAASDKVEISMFDIISLYPFVNYDSPYPVGIPKIIQSQNYIVNWTEPVDVPYDGLLKVKVVPPKDLMYPLLPLLLDDMLLFINCGVCAKKAKKEFVRAGDVEKCEHSDEERALLGTFTSIELRKALELGYKVIRFYRAYHFEEFDTQLFKGYVRMFLKIKVEASGWASDVKTEEEKQAFIDMYRGKYDIYLEPENMKKNPETPSQQPSL
uniref:DNA-directed DNA polymerase n=1 Tax=Globodera rostochiensis TaxID=31243 RepID=A0A914IBH3_GLORO